MLVNIAKNEWRVNAVSDDSSDYIVVVQVDGNTQAFSIPKSSRIKIHASLADCGSALGRRRVRVSIRHQAVPL